MLAILLLVGSFAVCLGLTGVVKSFATRKGFVCRPSVDRFSKRTVPLGGGIAIFITLSVIMLLGALAVKLSAVPPALAEQADIKAADFLAKVDELAVILLCAAALFVLGLWDDSKRLDPFFKLTVQSAAAIAVAALTETRVEFFIENRVITTVLSAFWIVLIINAFNFLDNMDGLAAGIAVIAGSILFAAATAAGQVFVGALTLVFVGALLGFLPYNFPPAKIFMGDAGSLVIGYFVALLTLRTTYYEQAQSGRWYAVFLPAIVMAVPLYDFISVTLLRISQGRSPFIGDTQHFSHRLKKHGLTDTQIVLTLYLATLTTGLGATFLYQVDFVGAVLIFLQTFLVLAIIAVFETAAGNDKTSD